MTSLSRTCPGRGESHPHRCSCGVMIYTYRGYERTAQLRRYHLNGTMHHCPPRWIPDMIECTCGAQVYRQQDGRKTDMDGNRHLCLPREPQAKHVAQGKRHTMNVEARHV